MSWFSFILGHWLCLQRIYATAKYELFFNSYQTYCNRGLTEIIHRQMCEVGRMTSRQWRRTFHCSVSITTSQWVDQPRHLHLCFATYLPWRSKTLVKIHHWLLSTKLQMLGGTFLPRHVDGQHFVLQSEMPKKRRLGNKLKPAMEYEFPQAKCLYFKLQTMDLRLTTDFYKLTVQTNRLK